ncbi:MAG TPA: prepilin-type N-terminal cleavage/methylation domain-containing protein [Rhodopila sp.]|uniref:prepilin-type N-terminal cleavage/methylation domain-containing protein n=1 Tax=Rhodopila sp. TaxID=2480087 RepID=UPI002CCA97F6|nr:prepilin-type N-terminal cleavage/methylation domain-containing protein [Rhodopila sp.]HVY15978.1 prepilin-type N-terminal cleavage/methylation domain-containing protein [Rhodopila sp.]
MKGFTLLEVVVALVVASLAAVALFEATSSGLSASQNAAQYVQALVRAKSRLDVTVYGAHLAPGTWTGDDGGGFRYRVQVTPIETVNLQSAVQSAARAEAAAKVVLYQVNVWIDWGRNPQRHDVHLVTQQIGG